MFFRGAYENNLQDPTTDDGYAGYGNKDNTPPSPAAPTS